jgi:hypothetical protein
VHFEGPCQSLVENGLSPKNLMQIADGGHGTASASQLRFLLRLLDKETQMAANTLIFSDRNDQGRDLYILSPERRIRS